MPRHSETVLTAIKNAVDIVALVGECLTLSRVGGKYKGLCPFHDDHNPSLEVNPDRQSYKCWSCGAGGDVLDFVQNHERVDFLEALRMLADRAGIVLDERPPAGGTARGPSKTELLEVNAWAEEEFARALAESPEACSYLKERGLSRESIERFRLGHAPAARGWLTARARRRGLSLESLERAGLLGRNSDGTGALRERFQGRLIFPIHDDRGRAVGFGGRILPSAEKAALDRGRRLAKYLNTPETPLFHKRTLLYAADLARAAARRAGHVVVVEGYTDAIAAHQVGLAHVVGTLGTALGVEHLGALRRLSESVVLVFDGDEAGQSAADRALELFLGGELELRVMTLPPGVDPCDFLLSEGAEAFQGRVEAALDPLAYLLDRARARFDFRSGEGARRAAEWVLTIAETAPTDHRLGLEVKRAKVLDTLSHQLGIPVATLNQMRRALRRPARAGASAARPASAGAQRPSSPSEASSAASEAGADEALPIRPADLDPVDLELVRIAVNEPSAVEWLVSRVAPEGLRDAPLRSILQTCYELRAEGREPTYINLMGRLERPAVRALATDLASSPALAAPELAPMSGDFPPAPWAERLERMAVVVAERARQARLAALRLALDQTGPETAPEAHRALELEYRRLLTQRLDSKNLKRLDPSSCASGRILDGQVG